MGYRKIGIFRTMASLSLSDFKSHLRRIVVISHASVILPPRKDAYGRLVGLIGRNPDR
jgi:hypothetical protein